MAKTVYKKKIKNGKEYYFYRLRHKNLSKPRDIYAPTVEELKSKIKALTTGLDNGIVSNKEYFGEFLKEWLYNTLLLNKKPSTKVRYDGIFRNYIKGSPIYDIKLKDLTASDIQKYYNDLIKKGKTVGNVRMLHKLINPCIRYAYDNNKLIKDFSRALVLPENKRLEEIDEVRPFTIEEQFKFIHAIEGNELEALYSSALDTGLREGELFALTWLDINFDKEYVDVNKSYKCVKNIETGKYEDVIQPPKTKNSIRKVPMPKHLINKLKQYHEDQKSLKKKMANLYKDKNLIFCNMYGNYLDSSNVLDKFKKILKDNSIPERRFHDLRHTYATRLFELGENPKTVQKLLGHSDISTTLDTYTHVLENIKEKAAAKIDDLYTNMDAK
jgi:integrase